MPTVAAVATLEPEDAAKIAHEPMFACIRPPGSHDSHWITASYMRFAMPARSMISPSRMNIGTATSTNSLLLSHVNSPIATARRPSMYIWSSARVSTPRTAATGTLATTSTSRIRTVQPATQAPPSLPRVLTPSPWVSDAISSSTFIAPATCCTRTRSPRSSDTTL